MSKTAELYLGLLCLLGPLHGQEVVCILGEDLEVIDSAEYIL